MTPQRPVVPPVEPGVPRPRWSVMIPTYHCAEFLSDTLRSVLQQDPGPDVMEIVVVDDHSVRDDPEAVVRHLGADRVRFVRQPRNVGHVRTFNRCLALSRGEIVHLLHGDDWVEDGFYAAADSAFRASVDLAGFVCRYGYAHEATGEVHDGPLLQEHRGVIDGWLELLAEGQRLQAPSTAVARAVYERVGGFDLGIGGYGEDWEMWLRVAAAGPVWWEPRRLAVYRIRSGSLSDRTRLRRNMADMRRVMALNERTLEGHVTPARAAELSDLARRSLALALLRRTSRAIGAGDLRAPFDAIVEAVRLRPTWEVLVRSAALMRRWVLARYRN